MIINQGGTGLAYKLDCFEPLDTPVQNVLRPGHASVLERGRNLRGHAGQELEVKLGLFDCLLDNGRLDCFRRGDGCVLLVLRLY